MVSLEEKKKEDQWGSRDSRIFVLTHKGCPASRLAIPASKREGMSECSQR